MNSTILLSSFFFALFVSLRLCARSAKTCAKTQRDKERKGIVVFSWLFTRHYARTAVALSFLMLLSGCATVKPWQREALADSIMQPDRNPMQSALLDHVYFSREASSGGRSVGGGGCGCN